MIFGLVVHLSFSFLFPFQFRLFILNTSKRHRNRWRWVMVLQNSIHKYGQKAHVTIIIRIFNVERIFKRNKWSRISLFASFSFFHVRFSFLFRHRIFGIYAFVCVCQIISVVNPKAIILLNSYFDYLIWMWNLCVEETCSYILPHKSKAVHPQIDLQSHLSVKTLT